MSVVVRFYNIEWNLDCRDCRDYRGEKGIHPEGEGDLPKQHIIEIDTVGEIDIYSLQDTVADHYSCCFSHCDIEWVD